MTEDGGFDFADGHPELGVAGTVGLFEQRCAHAGEHLPEVFQRINVAVRNAAAQVAVNVLQILRLGAVNVARESAALVWRSICRCCRTLSSS